MDINHLMRASPRCPWKAITSMIHIFRSLPRMKVGNGSRIRIWHDIWFGSGTLQEAYSRLFALPLVKEGLWIVSDSISLSILNLHLENL